MDDQTNVVEILPFDDIDDVGDVGVEIDILAQEMRTLAEPGQGGGKYLVTLLFQKSDTRRQYQPPTKVPWTSTNVFRAGWARAAPIISPDASAAAKPTLAAMPSTIRRRVMFDCVMRSPP
jgi:hypothetical protein